MADVFFTEQGQKRLDEQDGETRKRIDRKLREIRDWPEHFLKPLKGRDDYVLRVGDYRVLVAWEKNDGQDDALYVKSVGHRRNFYDRSV